MKTFMLLTLYSTEYPPQELLFGIIIGVCIALTAILFFVCRDRQKIKQNHIELVRKVQQQSLLQQQMPAAPYRETLAARPQIIMENRSENESLNAAIYKNLQKLMNEDKIYHDPKLTRDRVVSKIGTSRKTFLEVLQMKVNMTFIDYINMYRLNEAIYLLENGEYTNEAIAEEVGFGSANTFYRQFRVKYGISPAEYKKNQNNSSIQESHPFNQSSANENICYYSYL